jgi:putative methionine-R-sulfoxide reductase with GAF domain
MVNRFKKFFFKLTKDPKTGSESMTKYEMQQGLAGYAAASGSYVLCEDVAGDVRYE